MPKKLPQMPKTPPQTQKTPPMTPPKAPPKTPPKTLRSCGAAMGGGSDAAEWPAAERVPPRPRDRTRSPRRRRFAEGETPRSGYPPRLPRCGPRSSPPWRRLRDRTRCGARGTDPSPSRAPPRPHPHSYSLPVPPSSGGPRPRRRTWSPRRRRSPEDGRTRSGRPPRPPEHQRRRDGAHDGHRGAATRNCRRPLAQLKGRCGRPWPPKWRGAPKPRGGSSKTSGCCRRRWNDGGTSGWFLRRSGQSRPPAPALAPAAPLWCSPPCPGAAPHPHLRRQRRQRCRRRRCPPRGPSGRRHRG
mmetsp:Transcript_126319/g.365653  ORF Transcript_126319/g.365653 Transcript_126319/m.365653 type:complete len:299 (-) Transcript_126319:532-1428(-)